MLLLTLGISSTIWAQNSPEGILEVVGGIHGSIHVKGWCQDPDDLSTPLTVQVYVKDNNNQPVAGYNPIELTANKLRNGEDNQLHNNGYETYLFIATAGTYKVDVIHVDATDDGSAMSSRTGIQVSAPYTVTYNANGGNGAPAQQLKGENIDLTLSTTQPSNGSYGFICWNTASNGGGTSYPSGGTYSGNGNVTLYAMWTASFIPGSGTQADPYLISSTEQWNLFANNVNSGNTYNGKWVRLGADITVSTMAGKQTRPFKGTFDGAGHTMNLAIDGTTEVLTPHSNSEDYLLDVAPFRYVDGATFIDLNLTGFVKATEYSQYGIGLGGLVGMVAENHSVRILNCRSSVDVSYIFSHNLSGWGDNYTLGNMGGFIGTNAGTVVMDNCLFDGTLAGRPEYVGGFVGRQTPGTMTMSNCLMNGSGSGLYGTPQTVKITFCEVPSNAQHLTMTNCYYTNAMGTAQGTQTSNTGEALRSQLGSGWIVNGSGQVVPGGVARYTITIDENIANGTIVSSDAVSIPGETITLTVVPDQGYYGASVTYNDGTAHNLTPDYNECSFTMPEANVTVTGTILSSTVYTITYDLDGGSVATDNPTSYTEQSHPFTLVNPTRDGYTFAGWTGTGISGTSLNVTVPHGSTGNRTYTATWALNCTITYNLDGGTLPSPNPTTYSAMSDDITLVAPIRSGYVFAGWTGTGLSQATVNVVIPHGSTGNRSYTATWISTNYTISYNLDNGSVSPANPTSYTLTTPSFTLNNPTRSGYTFKGWVGTGIDGQVMTVTIPVGSVGNRSYTAIWALNGNVAYKAYNTYTDQFETRYANNPTTVVSTGTSWGSNNSETWYVLNSNVTVDGQISVSGTVNLILCDNCTLTVSNCINVDAGKTLNIYSQSGGTNGAIVANSSSDHAGIGGGSIGTICIHGGTITANGGSWSAGIGGGTCGGGGTIAIYGGDVKGTAGRPNGNGDARGIGRGSACGGTQESTVIIADGMSLGSYLYSARSSHMGDSYMRVLPCPYSNHSWTNGRCKYCNKRQNLKVTYNANNATSGSVPTDATQYSNAGTGTATVLGNTGNLQRTGFVFARWNTAADGSGTSYSAGQTFQVYHDVTLYAYWAEVYPITYDLAGGSLATANPTGYHLFSDNITLNNPTREGYTFVGWTGSNGNMPQQTVVIPAGSIGARTYTANWAPIVHLAVNTDNTQAIAQSSNNAFTTVVLDGYTFRRDGSWNTLCLPFALGNFTGTPLEGATVKTLSASTVTGNTLTATFANATSTVTGKPYIVKWEPDLIIRTQADWNTFANNVNSGTESYQDKTVMLAADITVTTMVGTGSNYSNIGNLFRGTFDGCGHTLNLNIQGGSSEGAAPFHYIGGATIKNVKTTGTVSGANHCSGLVGFAASNTVNTIQNCWVDADITCSTTHSSGILGWAYCATVRDCLFSGSITGSTTATGIIYGWGDDLGAGTNHTIINCLAAGTYTNCGGIDMLARYNNRGTPVVTNCYKTQEIGSYGTYTTATGETLRALLGDGWQVIGSTVVPKTVSGIENPMFTNVSISTATQNVTTTYADFVGSYAPFSVGSQLPDTANLACNAFHGALRIGDVMPPTGYLIGGWYTDAGLTIPATSVTIAPSGEVTLYALYTPISYTVAFDANTGTGSMTSQSFTYDAAQNLTASTFTRTGHLFAGWSTTTDGPVEYTDGQSVSNLASEDGATVTLYAQWTPITYIVHFDKNHNDATGTMADQTLTYDAPESLSANAFVLTDYGFTGWSTTAGGSIVYGDGESVLNLANGQDDVVNLYAQWSEAYTIDYNLAGGSVATPNPATYTEFTSIITLVNPTRPGYTFTGWTGTGLSEATMEVTIPMGSTGNRSYTATWTPTIYTISYDLASGSVATVNPTTYTVESEDITLVNPTREGFTFAGWTGTDLTEATTTVTIPTGSYGDRSFVATWLENALTLAADADNNAAITAANGLLYDVTIGGYTLYRDGSWNTLCVPFDLDNLTGTPLEGATIKELSNSEFETQNSELSISFNNATVIDAGKPYIVKWTEDAINEMEADLVIHSQADWNTFATNVNNGTDSYQGKIVKLAADISVTTMVGTVSGSTQQNAFMGTFDGCGHTLNVTISDGSNQGTAPFRYISNATIKNIKTTGTVTGNLHCSGLVGFSSGSTNTIRNCHVAVSVVCSGGNHSHCGGILGHSLNSVTTITDCLFSGSISGTTTATGIIFGWGGNATHTIVNCLAAGTYSNCKGIDMLKQNNGTMVATNSYKTQNVGSKGTYTTATGETLRALLGDGWEVVNGNVVPKMQSTIGNIENPVFADVVIDDTPISTINSQLITFTGSYAPITDGLLDEHNPNGNAQHAALSISDPTTAPTGYNDFIGWYIDAEKTVAATSIPFAANGNVTLYAKYTPNTYSVRFNKNSDAASGTMENQQFNYDEAQNLSANSFVTSTTGYHFGGWSTTADGPVVYSDGQSVINLASQQDAVVDLYAQWTAIVYSITYNLGGGSLTTTHNSYTVNDATITLDNPTRTGYTFAGWYDNSGFTGNAVTVIPASSTGDVVLWARWTPIVYTISYDLADGTVATPNPTSYTIESEPITLVNPTKEGYSFYGWTGTGIANATMTVTIETGSYGDRTYTANWKRVLTLYSDADNTATITAADGETIDSLFLSGYTFYRNNSWNTFCVPFDLGSFSGTPLEAATVKSLEATDYTDGTLTMSFADATTIVAGKPYIVKWTDDAFSYVDADLVIRTQEDWNTFANRVNNGTETYEGKTVKLAADITVSTMVGNSSSNAFKGTFDGCGHTLTFNVSLSQEFVAPFRYVYGATIQNLTVGGSNTSSKRQNAGLIAWSNGTVTISNCVVSATVTNNVGSTSFGSGNSASGGIIAQMQGGSVTMNNCLFSGKILGSANYFGGFVGWRNGTPGLVLNNCLFNPSQLKNSPTYTSTFFRGGNSNYTFNNTYYKTAFGDVQGTQTSATGGTLRSQLGDGWEVDASGNVVPIMQSQLVDIENPVFNGMVISNTEANVTTEHVTFSGSYAPYTEGLLDSNNPDGYALHAAIGINNSINDGYIFNGWYSDAQLTQAITQSNSQAINPIPFAEDGSVTLYANRTPVTYTVRFNKNNDAATGTMDDQSFTYDVAQPLTANAFAMAGGLNFVGWSTTENGAVEYTDGQNVMNLAAEQGAVVNLYAIWTTIYTIDYDLAGGSVAGENPANYSVYSSDITLVNPTREYYNFAGWTGTGLTEATMTVTIPMGSTGNRSYTATWTPVVYTISYDLAGGSMATDNPATYTIESEAITLVNPTREGYTFAGWTGGLDSEIQNSNFEVQNSQIVTIPTGSYGNRTYTASWLENALTLAANADNNTAITSVNGLVYDVTLDGYTFYRDGSWNTLCVPFNLDNLTGTHLEGATIKEMTNSEFDSQNSELSITFNSATDIVAGKPYIVKWTEQGLGADLVIRSAADWDVFAANVNNGTDSYQNKTVKLAADISVTTMVGVESHKFQGTFDGCGHTLTVNLDGVGTYGAPFQYLNGATIRNLHVDGSINGTDILEGGIAGRTYGTTRIENCRSSVSLTSTKGNNAAMGGLAGVAESGSLIVTNCLFDGSLLGSNNTNCAGIVNWRRNSAPINISNSLFAPTQVTVSTSGASTIARAGSVTNCYYTQTLGTAQGSAVGSRTAAELAADLGSGWTVNGESVVPKMENTVGNIVNPMFADVVIDDSPISTINSQLATFIGSYAPITDGLLDSNNPDGEAQHAALSISEPTAPEGYSGFVGWFADAELTQAITQSNNQAINPIPFATDGSVTLYAKWNPVTYTVHFNKNNEAATGTMDDQAFTYDEAQPLTPNGFTMTGNFNFAGWSTTENGLVEFTDGQNVMNLATVQGAVVNLYAIWTTIYTIDYDLAGGTVAGENPTTYSEYNSDITLVNPTREGYTFAGWTGTGLTEATMTVVITSGSTGDRSYTATWTPITYSISYDLAGGSVATDNPVTYTIETQTFTLVNPTKAGYNFAGWTGIGLDAASTTVTIDLGSTGDRSYTATWTPVTYMVRFNKNSDAATGTMENQLFTYDVAQNLTSNSFTTSTPGYGFAGWSTTADGEVVYSDGQSVSNLASQQDAVVDLYAQWTPIVFSINYHLGGGSLTTTNNSYTVNDATITLDVPTRTYYVFAGWYDNSGFTGNAVTVIASGSTGNVELWAKWTPITYTITYDLAGGSVATSNPTSYTIESEPITLVNPTREDYFFTGWTGTDLTNAVTTVTIPTGSTGDRSYTANWIELGDMVPYLAYDTTTGTFEPQLAQIYTTVSSSTIAMSDGWYVVNSNTPINSRIEVTGTVNLILCDDATLTVNKGLHVPSGVTLNIYGQSYGTGSIALSGSGISYGYAGIGGNGSQNGGTLSIHGGIVTTKGGSSGPGIGGGNGSGYNGGSVAIYGGTVNATGGDYAAGIGGGDNGSACTSVVITGGTVNATGSYGGAGIGGGWRGNGGNSVVITGGIVNATGGSYSTYYNGAGIGGGWNGAGYTSVNITGGIVTAIAGNSSAQAIGCGQESSSSGTLAPFGDMKVFASADATEPVALENRISTCRTAYARIEHCTEHNWVENACSWCGATCTGVVYGRNHATSGTAPVDNTNYAVGQTVTVLGNTGNLEREGYTYVGWNSAADNNGTDYPAGYQFGFSGNITLYAKWTLNTYTISYNGIEGATFAATNPSEYTPESNDITLVNPTKDGYAFGGWTGTGLTAATIAVTIPTGSTGDRSYTANWLPILEYQAYSTTTNYFETLTAAAYLDVTDTTTTMSNSWYAVRGNLYISSRINITGTVNLILCDGATLTAPKGIHIPSGVTLNIYGQANGTGALTISSVADHQAAIGSNENGAGGIVTIHGGNITVTGGYYAAGIGTGYDGDGGTYTIYGGTVTATGGYGGSGIGTGIYANGGTVTITGGVVNATGGTSSTSNGAGIGGYYNGGTVTITGGTVTAKGGGYGGAGIGGGGSSGNGGTVTITGGIVNATGGSYSNYNGAGIGGGYNGSGGSVTITGGTVIAKAGNSSAQAIGRGGGSKGSGNLTLGVLGVYASQSAAYPVALESRVSTCRTDYAKIMPCTEHNWVNNACTWCGAVNNGVAYGRNNATSGTVPVDATNYAVDQTVTVLGNTGNLERTGYTYEGWNTVADGMGTTYAANDAFQFSSPVTLYAKWAPIEYSITYNGIEGATFVSSNPDTYTIESSDITLNNPTKDGYLFYGWIESVNSQPSSLNPQPSVTIPTGSTGDRSYTAVWALDTITLLNNADNSSTISAANGDLCLGVTLSGYTFYRDGSWNTLCVPFDVDNLTGTPLEGATVKTLSNSTYNDGTLTATFEDATEIDAGTPYIVKWEEPDLIISSQADWNTFANNIGNYQNKTVKLATDLSVTSMVSGTFNGTLDGCGHTITLRLSGGNEELALFTTLQNATIKNLKIEGTINFNRHRPASIASYIAGTTTIMNCWSSVTITSNYNPTSNNASNNWVDGGALVARVNTGATLNMSDCLFTGSVTYNTKNNQGGGMVGWAQGSTSVINLTHCLFAPSAMTMTDTDPKNKTYVFVSGEARGNLTGCYYNTVAQNVNASVLRKDGTYTTATGETLRALLGNGWMVIGESVVPKMANTIIDETNPVFTNVTLDDSPLSTPNSQLSTFSGSYAPFGSGLFDSHNPNGDAQHAVLTIADPTVAPTGYNDFEGWFTNAECTAAVSTIPFSTDGNVTLYAKWAPIEYSITYNGVDGATFASDNPNTYTIESSSITLDNPTKEGYTFTGWTGSNGETPQTSVTIATGSTGDKSYTANWTPVEYTITYTLNGGTLNTTHNSYTIESADFALDQPTKEGYTFTGWTGSNGETPQTSVTITTGSTGDKSYTANWTINTYTITFEDWDGTELQSSQVAYGETPVYSGATPTRAADAQYTYTFNGWSPAIAAVTGDATYTAQFTETVNEYTITFVNYDNTELQSSQVAYGETPTYTGATPTRAATEQYSYTFNGWSPAIAAVTANATYTAQYTQSVREYTITYNGMEGATIASPNPTTYTAESGDITLNNPTKTGYTFIGWTGSNGETPQTSVIIASGTTGDLTYTANWTLITYTITFENWDNTVLQSSQVAYGETPAYTGETPTRAATAQYIYAFNGWLPEIVAVAGNATYTAQYTEIETLHDVPYRAYNTTTNQFETLTATTCSIINSQLSTLNSQLSGGWYAVNSDVTIGSKINLTGTVNLILCDGATLTAEQGFKFVGGATLNIYGQTGGTGTLSSGNDITTDWSNEDNMTVHGGNFSLNGRWGISINGDIAIYGGDLDFDVTGSAISSGDCNVTIYGGNIDIDALDEFGTGIYLQESSSVVINGGTIDITANDGILTYYGNNYITINGGDITFNSTGNGYHSTGFHTDGGDLTINGGNITCTITELGYGSACFEAEDGDIVINGGNISAIVNDNPEPNNEGFGFYTHNGDIILGWSSPNDRIYSSSYEFFDNGTLSVRSGQSFWNGSENISGTITDFSKVDDKTLVPYTTTDLPLTVVGGWQAISSPMFNNSDYSETIADVTGMTTGVYDMFRYNESNATWENQKAGSGATGFETMERGRGYIYRSSTAATLTFVGQTNSGNFAYAGTNDVDSYGDITATCPDANLTGFHLVGNPYSHAIYKGVGMTGTSLSTGYYELRPDGTWLVHTDSDPIAVGQAVLVKATQACELSYTDNAGTQAPSPAAGLSFSVTDGTHTDVTYAMMGNQNEKGLHKIGHLEAGLPTLSIPQGSDRYAIAAFDQETEQFEMDFTALDGTYTLQVNSEELKGKSYLHLIDRATGKDIDLLSQPTYTFTHSSNQAITPRFLVRLSGLGSSLSDLSSLFAYQEGDHIVITEAGTLQVFDLLGRKLLTKEITTSNSQLSILNFPGTGVYVLRLDNKTQKLVIK